jgi:methylenetetrahydrofolate dehydrogenase (NADP+)/methenyltetrahydrofolate cyclohydrolase
MPAKILDGRKTSAEVREELKERVKKLQEKGVTPKLCGILVGEDPGSITYVRLKEKASEEVGVHSEMVRLPEDIKEDDLLKEIERLNSDAKIHGIFIQLPLPKHLDESKALNAISPDKDVDGFHPLNVGRAWIGEPIFIPACPVAIHEMLTRGGYDPGGKEVVIVNVDNMVGKPLASIWVQEKEKARANITLCHPSAPNLASYTQRADILVVSVDKPKFITADMVKEGVIAFDFGSNWVEDPETKKRKTVGDIDFEAVKEKAEAITPVPGGIGPMLVTMLLANTVRAAETKAEA